MKTREKAKIALISYPVIVGVGIFTSCPPMISTPQVTIEPQKSTNYVCELKNRLPSEEPPQRTNSSLAASASLSSITASGTVSDFSPSPSPEDFWGVS